MDFSNDANMQNIEMGNNVENEDDLQVLANNIVQEESEELIFEETESDIELDDVKDVNDELEEPKKSFTIMGFTLEQNHIYMLVGLLLIIVFFLYKEQILDFVNGLVNNKTEPSNPLMESFKNK